MSITPFPSQGQYPWYDQLKNWGTDTQTAAENATIAADQAHTDAALAQATADAAVPNRPPLSTGTDLDTVIGIGIYPVNYPTTLALNFPLSSTFGVLEVLPRSSTSVVQRYSVVSGPSDTRAIFVRRLNNGVWNAWRTTPTQRIDNSAGRAIYTWDETANREQRTGGDTGVRDISGLIVGSTGTAQMRRFGDIVEIAFNNLNATAWTGTTTLPNGFRPSGTTRTLILLSGVAEGRLLALTNGNLTGDKAYYQGAYSTTYFTTDPWPTTLPGTAVGTIPFN